MWSCPNDEWGMKGSREYGSYKYMETVTTSNKKENWTIKLISYTEK